MIPVTLQPEPADFDEKVRQKGLDWLVSYRQQNGKSPLGKELPSYWSAFNEQLWEAYSGTCAYLAIFFEFASGAASTDHFVAKSSSCDDAYEWNNYRLSCLASNRNKNKFDDVLDPVGLAQNTFTLNLANGAIKPNSSLAPDLLLAARATIRRLKLDNKIHRDMRLRHFNRYLRGGMDAPTLKELSPFVWHEANRQGLL